MKMFVEPADIYLYMDIVDFRKSINGLIVVVEQDMDLNPFRDALFVFCNKKPLNLGIEGFATHPLDHLLSRGQHVQEFSTTQREF